METQKMEKQIDDHLNTQNPPQKPPQKPLQKTSPQTGETPPTTKLILTLKIPYEIIDADSLEDTVTREVARLANIDRASLGPLSIEPAGPGKTAVSLAVAARPPATEHDLQRKVDAFAESARERLSCVLLRFLCALEVLRAGEKSFSFGEAEGGREVVQGGEAVADRLRDGRSFGGRSESGLGRYGARGDYGGRDEYGGRGDYGGSGVSYYGDRPAELSRAVGGRPGRGGSDGSYVWQKVPAGRFYSRGRPNGLGRSPYRRRRGLSVDSAAWPERSGRYRRNRHRMAVRRRYPNERDDFGHDFGGNYDDFGDFGRDFGDSDDFDGFGYGDELNDGGIGGRRGVKRQSRRHRARNTKEGAKGERGGQRKGRKQSDKEKNKELKETVKRLRQAAKKGENYHKLYLAAKKDFDKFFC